MLRSQLHSVQWGIHPDKCAWNCNLDSMRQTALIHRCNSLAMLQETILHIRVKMASSNCFGTAKMFSSFTTLAVKRLDFKINFHEMGSGREGVAAKDNFCDRCNSFSALMVRLAIWLHNYTWCDYSIDQIQPSQK